MATNDISKGQLAKSGALAGLIAGIAMAMVAMIYAASRGMGLFAPPRQIAAVLQGPEALLGGGGTIILGIMIHMMVSIVWGIVFGLIAGRLTAGGQFGAGMVYGAVLWFIMSFLVLPWANETMGDRTKLVPAAWFIEHLVFGGMLFLTAVFARHHERGRGEPHISGAAHA